MHKRLLHAFPDVVTKAYKTAGLTVTGEVKHCPTYHIAKSTEIISRASAAEVTTPGQLIRVDVIICQPGHLDFRYMVHFVDQYSGYHWVKFVVSKADVFDVILKFVAHFERQSGLRVQSLGLDGGSEFGLSTVPFGASRLRDWAGREGVNLVITTPYTSHMNGRPERAGRTICTKARSSLIEANLPLVL
ncbi:Ribonuclease H-like protein [Niveomyces insectorum RCEF 264]|uniref:Ribonuclease H-like protein n=1 Tax=Niveomyces insectorum RCEF 264 TaxID=1081102 RepID=A0A167TTA0_9HYPO|nr:Ribonuclease H-like protein [Niveomyces insectorum RCEF 264]